MRKFIIKHFELSTHIRIFSKTIITLRAPRILFPLFVLVGIIVVGDPRTYTFFWYHAPAYIILGIGIYFGFLYSRFYPYKWDELDLEQQYFWMKAYNKTGGGMKNIFPYDDIVWARTYRDLDDYMKDTYYTGRFNNLRSFYGLLFAIIIIILWHIYHLPK